MELKVSAFTILYQRDYNNVGAETGANPAEWANTTNAIKTTEYAKESTWELCALCNIYYELYGREPYVHETMNNPTWNNARE